MKKYVLLLCSLCLLHAQNTTLNAKVYHHSEDGYPTSLDPLQSATTYANRIVTAVYDRLFEYKYLQRTPYELKPCLAKKMPKISADGLTYTIKIKKGIYFANDVAFQSFRNPQGNGREVIAQDFVYSIKRHFDFRNSSQGSWLWRGRIVGLDEWAHKSKSKRYTNYNEVIEGLKTIDKYTIQIKLTKPYPQIIYTFATGFSSIVSREAVMKHKQRLRTHPVGSGPFRLTSFNRSKAVLEKNPNYRKETFDIYGDGYDENLHGFTGIKKLYGKTLPILDRVEIHFGSREQRWLSFNKKDGIQLSDIPKFALDSTLASKRSPRLKKHYAKKFHLHPHREAGLVFLVFNMEDPSFGYHPDKKRNKMNKALRKAIRKTFDWRERIDTFYYGIGEPFVGVIPPGIVGYSEFPKDSITRDVGGAKKLLKDAGWTSENLPLFVYPSVASITSNRFFKQIQGWLIDIGYPKNKILHREFSTFGDLNKAMKLRKNSMNAYGWGLDYPDAENTMMLFYGPNASPGANAANFNHPEFNRLFEKASLMPNSPERTKLYKLMTEILLEECVGIFGFSRMRLTAWHKNVIAYPTSEILNNFFKYVDVK
ncbi:ABC transporter substrate-binding protein [Candidatus Uabimicrobium sp. HlEnr_7]|uniref:ABC transporter substrate-binding protein n=1 Tax=Candidatus Uabimicrobium helgolandensis TaxID=3095367 RepID=UPI003557FA82